jgi:hypothetical protein
MGLPEIRQQCDELLAFFKWQHLPPHLQAISRPFGELAVEVSMRPLCGETVACLRKLLEAKDCAVRAALMVTG